LVDAAVVGKGSYSSFFGRFRAEDPLDPILDDGATDLFFEFYFDEIFEFF